MDGLLNGRRALVTAGGSGIGRVIAQRLTDAGARCMICDVDAAALDEGATIFGSIVKISSIPVDGDQTSLG